MLGSVLPRGLCTCPTPRTRWPEEGRELQGRQASWQRGERGPDAGPGVVLGCPECSQSTCAISLHRPHNLHLNSSEKEVGAQEGCLTTIRAPA